MKHIDELLPDVIEDIAGRNRPEDLPELSEDEIRNREAGTKALDEMKALFN